MKGDGVGAVEELMLLAVRALGDRAYAVAIQQFIARSTGRDVAIGAVYAALDRLEHKGYLRSEFGDPTPVRGGKPKRVYCATPLGTRTVREMRAQREAMWRAIRATGQ